MIKLKDLIFNLILERMSYAELMNSSDPDRKDRSSRIPAKSLQVTSQNDKEAWKFSYRTPKSENTTGLRHQGFIYFFKDSINPGDNAMNIDCSVDCSCPDYRYRFSYANKSNDAGINGVNSLNKGLNYPSSINAGPGLCKHLLSLKEYLKTKIDTEPTSPDKPISTPVVVPKSPPASKIPPEEPEPKITPDVEKLPNNPTQTPDPDINPTQVMPAVPVDNPTQTPQKPTEVPIIDPTQSGEIPIEEPVDNPKKPKSVKESNTNNNIVAALDDICKNNNIFMI